MFRNYKLRTHIKVEHKREINDHLYLKNQSADREVYNPTNFLWTGIIDWQYSLIGGWIIHDNRLIIATTTELTAP